MNGVFFTSAIELIVCGVAVKDISPTYTFMLMKYSPVDVIFSSVFANMEPTSNCGDINANTLSHYLTMNSLFKYKSICIHRKGLHYVVIIS